MADKAQRPRQDPHTRRVPKESVEERRRRLSDEARSAQEDLKRAAAERRAKRAGS